MKKRLLMLFVLFIGLILIAACGSGADETDETEQGEPEIVEEDDESSDKTSSDSTTDEESTDDSSSDDADSTAGDGDQSTSSDETDNDGSIEQSNNSSSSDNGKPEAEVITTGIFVGQADPHTIEIETEEAEEGWAAYQLTMEARDMVVDLEPGDEVTYTYHKDGEMLVIEHIEKVN